VCLIINFFYTSDIEVFDRKLKDYHRYIVLMALPKNYGGNRSSRKNKMRNLGQFAECWTGTGIMIGIWAVTFGILASGILSL